MWQHHDLVLLVERLGIDQFFVRVDGLRRPGGGGKAEHLVEHLAALELAPRAVVLVGDSLDDLAAARAVGAGCVLYDGGCTTVTLLRPQAPRWSTTSPPRWRPPTVSLVSAGANG